MTIFNSEHANLKTRTKWKKKLIYGEVKVCRLKTREIIFTLHTGRKCVMTGGAECAHSACYNFGHDYAKLGIQFVLSYLIGFL